MGTWPRNWPYRTIPKIQRQAYLLNPFALLYALHCNRSAGCIQWNTSDDIHVRLDFAGCNWERMLHGDDLAWKGRRMTSILTWLNACYFARSCFMLLLLCLTLITHCCALLRPVTVQPKDPFTHASSWTNAIVLTIAILYYWVNKNCNHNCKNGYRTHTFLNFYFSIPKKSQLSMQWKL